MTAAGPLVALVHATTTAIRPAVAALREEIPRVRVWNLLDDRLLADYTDAGGLTDGLRDRMSGLVSHAMTGGADAVALTCSAYSPTVDDLASRWDRPVVKPDEAMYRQVVTDGHSRVAILCSTPAAAEPALQLLATSAGDRDAVAGETVLCTEAAVAADADDRDALVEALSRCARPVVDRGVDALLLAQYSLSAAADALRETFGVPCYSGPRGAARALRTELGVAA